MGSRPTNWDSIRQQVYKRDDYTCQNCGTRGGRGGSSELHAHHGVPLSKGGSNQIENLTTYCKDCHRAIHNKSAVAPTSQSESSKLTDEQESVVTTVSVVIGITSAIFLTVFSSSIDAWGEYWFWFVMVVIVGTGIYLNTMGSD